MTTRSKDKQNNITVKASFLAPIGSDVEFLFKAILEDYTKRFNCSVQEGEWHVDIVGLVGAGELLYGENGGALTGQINIVDKRMMIWVADPHGDDHCEHPFVGMKFMTTLCHEIVHACQEITGRKPKSYARKLDKTDLENYFFDPFEVEARVLEDFYAVLFVLPSLMEGDFEFETLEKNQNGDRIRYRSKRLLAAGKQSMDDRSA